MITLNTIVYEGNFMKLLNEDSWFFNFNSNLITKKMITVNNISSTFLFEELVNDLLLQFDFDLIYVTEHEEKAKEFFNLNINSHTRGYVYTLPYFTTILNTNTKYLLNIATDCMDDISIDNEFFNLAINELENNPICSSTMVAWTKNNYIMKNGRTIGEYEEEEIFKIIPKRGGLSKYFNYTLNFTDQFFFNSIDNLKKIDYNIDEKYADKIYKGPDYGGNSFEKRMVAHQVYNNLYNCISKNKNYYIHDKNYY
jgi:hypothetical protein